MADRFRRPTGWAAARKQLDKNLGDEIDAVKRAPGAALDFIKAGANQLTQIPRDALSEAGRLLSRPRKNYLGTDAVRASNRQWNRNTNYSTTVRRPADRENLSFAAGAAPDSVVTPAKPATQLESDQSQNEAGYWNEETLAAAAQSDAQMKENNTQSPRDKILSRRNYGGDQDMIQFQDAGGRRVWTNVGAGEGFTQDDMDARNTAINSRFSRGFQGAASGDRVVAVDDDRARRTQAFAERFGVPEISQAGRDLYDAQQAGEVPVEQPSEGGGPRFFRVGQAPGSGIGAGVSADIIGAARALRGRREAAQQRNREAAASQQGFDNRITEMRTRGYLGSSRAQLLNAQNNATPDAEPGTFKLNLPEVDPFSGAESEYGTIEANGREYAVKMDEILEIQNNAAYLLSLDPTLTESQAQDQALKRFIRGLTSQQE